MNSRSALYRKIGEMENRITSKEGGGGVDWDQRIWWNLLGQCRMMTFREVSRFQDLNTLQEGRTDWTWMCLKQKPWFGPPTVSKLFLYSYKVKPWVDPIYYSPAWYSLATLAQRDKYHVASRSADSKTHLSLFAFHGETHFTIWFWRW